MNPTVSMQLHLPADRQLQLFAPRACQNDRLAGPSSHNKQLVGFRARAPSAGFRWSVRFWTVLPFDNVPGKSRRPLTDSEGCIIGEDSGFFGGLFMRFLYRRGLTVKPTRSGRQPCRCPMLPAPGLRFPQAQHRPPVAGVSSD